MEEARLRALKLSFQLHYLLQSIVEMEEARLRALKHYLCKLHTHLLRSRNGRSPVEGIETLIFVSPSAFTISRNGRSPVEGIETPIRNGFLCSHPIM